MVQTVSALSQLSDPGVSPMRSLYVQILPVLASSPVVCGKVCAQLRMVVGFPPGFPPTTVLGAVVQVKYS